MRLRPVYDALGQVIDMYDEDGEFQPFAPVLPGDAAALPPNTGAPLGAAGGIPQEALNASVDGRPLGRAVTFRGEAPRVADDFGMRRDLTNLDGGPGFLEMISNSPVLASGAADVVQDVGDFGAAVIDTIRGQTPNEADNWFQPSRFVAQPRTQLGKLGKDIVSFLSIFLPTSNKLDAIAEAGKLGQTLAGTGLVGNVARGALSGVAVDLVTIKPYEENIFDMVRGTPLENPVTNFLASDQDGVSSAGDYWLGKIRQAIGGMVLGSVLDVGGEVVSRIFRRSVEEPLVTVLQGLKEAKTLPDAEAAKYMAEKVLPAAQERAIVLREELDSALVNLGEAKIEPYSPPVDLGNASITGGDLTGQPDRTALEGAQGLPGLPQGAQPGALPGTPEAASLPGGVAGQDPRLTGAADPTALPPGRPERTEQLTLEDAALEQVFSLEKQRELLQNRRDLLQEVYDSIEVDGPSWMRRNKRVQQKSVLDAIDELDRQLFDLDDQIEAFDLSDAAINGADSAATQGTVRTLKDARREAFDEYLVQLAAMSRADLIKEAKALGIKVSRKKAQQILEEIKLLDSGAVVESDSQLVQSILAKKVDEFFPTREGFTQPQINPDNPLDVQFPQNAQVDISGDPEMVDAIQQAIEFPPNGAQAFTSENYVPPSMRQERTPQPYQMTPGEGEQVVPPQQVNWVGENNPPVETTRTPQPYSMTPEQAPAPDTTYSTGSLGREEILRNPELPFDAARRQELQAQYQQLNQQYQTLVEQAKKAKGADVDKIDRELVKLQNSMDQIEAQIQNPRQEFSGSDGDYATPGRRNAKKVSSDRKPQPYSMSFQKPRATPQEIRENLAGQKLETERVEAQKKPLVDEENLKQAIGNTFGVESKAPRSKAYAERPAAKVASMDYSDEATERFMNYQKLSNDKDVQETLEMVMNGLADAKIRDSTTFNRELGLAKAFWTKTAGMTAEEVDRVFAEIAKDADRLPFALVAGRLAIKELGKVVNTTAKQMDSELAQGVVNEATKLKFLDTLARLEMFMVTVKNKQKAAAQAVAVGRINLDRPVAAVDVERPMVNSGAYQSVEEYYAELQRMVRNIGPQHRETLKKAARDIANAGDNIDELLARKDALYYTLRNLNKSASVLDGIRMSGILSGTRTFMGNAISGAVQTVVEPTTEMIGFAMEAPFRLIAGKSVDFDQFVQSRDTLISAFGAIGDGFKAFHEALKAGDAILDPASQILEDADRINLLNPGTGNNLLDLVLKGVSLPQRLLLASDEAIKHINYRAYVRAEALRVGRQQGLAGEKLLEYTEEIMRNSFQVDPVTGVRGAGLNPKALEYARFVTFTNEITADNSGSRKYFLDILNKATDTSNNKLLGWVGKIFFPFKRTPLNILAKTGRMSPLAFFSKSWQQDFAAGGVRRSKALGELGVGSMLLAYGITQAQAGNITGAAPKDPTARQIWLDQKKQPYSIKLDGKWYSYLRLDPFASHLSMIADVNNVLVNAAESDQDEAWAAATAAFMASIRDKTFLRGLSDVLALFEGTPERAGEYGDQLDRIVAGTITSYIPYSSLLREARRTYEPEIRDAEGILERIKDSLPGFGEGIPLKRHWLTGKPLLYQPALLNPFPMVEEAKKDKDISRILDMGMTISPPTPSIKSGAVELTREQYEKYLALTGTIQNYEGKTLLQSLKEVLAESNLTDQEMKLIKNSPEYRDKHPVVQKVKKIVSKYKEYAQERLIESDPDLQAKLEQHKKNTQEAKQGDFQNILKLNGGN